jgi:hypothetical protein
MYDDQTMASGYPLLVHAYVLQKTHTLLACVVRGGWWRVAAWRRMKNALK